MLTICWPNFITWWQEILSSHLVLEVHIRQSYLFCHTSLMKLLTIVSFPHDNLVNKCWPTIFKNIFMTYYKSVSMSLFYLDWTWNLRRSRISRNLLENWNKYLKKHEFCPPKNAQKTLKNHLIYIKDSNVSLNIVWECILCVMGFQMTYRTCSYE